MSDVLPGRLVVLAPVPLQGRTAPVEADVVLVGRDPRSTLVLDDPHVSRQHVALRRTRGGLVAEDLGSSAGTRLNDRPLSGPTPVQDGDVLELAGVTVRYEGPGQRADRTRAMAAVADGAAHFAVHEQRSDVLNNVDGNQYNYYRQERESFLREIAASKSRARGLLWFGFFLSVAGTGVYMAVVLRFISSVDRTIGEVSRLPRGAQPPMVSPTQLLGPEIAGVPLAAIAIFVAALGGVIFLVGLVLHVTAAARARKVDRSHPLPVPPYGSS